MTWDENILYLGVIAYASIRLAGDRYAVFEHRHNACHCIGWQGALEDAKAMAERNARARLVLEIKVA